MQKILGKCLAALLVAALLLTPLAALSDTVSDD